MEFTYLDQSHYFAIFIISGFTWTVYLLIDWMKCIYDGLKIGVIKNYYWSRVDKPETSCNLSLLLAPELFSGPSKCIRLLKKESDFSWKHKKTLVDDVMHNKDIGTITLRKKRDNYAVHYHEVVDGNSRLIALHDFMNDQFSWNHKRFSELSGEKRLFFREYKIGIRIIE